MGAGVSTEDSDEEQPKVVKNRGKSDPAASKPWVELNDPGNVMMTLGRRRVEWSVRMGVIYCVTMLYAVSEHVSNSRVFGTWPILANFYGTFAIASSVGGAVTGCIEMARGCTIGTLLAIATVEVTLAADNNLAQSTGLLSGILGALFVAVTITPILTKSEKKMLRPASGLLAVAVNRVDGVWVAPDAIDATPDARQAAYKHTGSSSASSPAATTASRGCAAAMPQGRSPRATTSGTIRSWSSSRR